MNYGPGGVSGGKMGGGMAGNPMGQHYQQYNSQFPQQGDKSKKYFSKIIETCVILIQSKCTSIIHCCM